MEFMIGHSLSGYWFSGISCLTVIRIFNFCVYHPCSFDVLWFLTLTNDNNNWPKHNIETDIFGESQDYDKMLKSTFSLVTLP